MQSETIEDCIKEIAVFRFAFLKCLVLAVQFFKQAGIFDDTRQLRADRLQKIDVI